MDGLQLSKSKLLKLSTTYLTRKQLFIIGYHGWNWKDCLFIGDLCRAYYLQQPNEDIASTCAMKQNAVCFQIDHIVLSDIRFIRISVL